MYHFEETVGLETISPTPAKRDDDQNPFLPVQVSSVLERPYKIADITWSNTQTIGTAIYSQNILHQWLAQPLPTDLVSYYKYFACDLVVSVRMQSTMMHYGKLAMNWLPCVNATEPTYSHRAGYALETYIMDANKPSVEEITIPFLHPLKFWNYGDYKTPMSDMALGPWFKIFVLNPVNNAQSATTSVPITIWVRATNIRLAGPTKKGASIYSKSFFQSSQDMSIPAGNDGTIDNGRPNIESTPTFVSVRQMASVGHSREPDSCVKLSMAADTVMNTDESMVQALKKNEMNLISICKRPSLYDIFTIQPMTDFNVAFTALPTVAPSIAPGLSLELTNMQVISRLANFWQGSLKVMVTFACSHVSTMRIGVWLNYGDYLGPTPNDQLLDVWDITGSTTKTLTVPQLSNYPYFPVGTAPPVNISGTYYGNPIVTFATINKLTTGNPTAVTSPAYMTIFIAAGDDFRLFLPVGVKPTDSARMPGPSVFQCSQYQDNLSDLFSVPFPVVGGSGEPVQLPEYNFGEELIDIRDILCRYMNVATHVATSPQTIVRALPYDWFKGFYRFNRYSTRVKLYNTLTNTTVWYSGNGNASSSHAPWDVVADPTKSWLQYELPFYEPWYYDLPKTVPNSSATIFGTVLTIDWAYVTSVSSDSVFAFPTVAYVWTAPS